MLQPESVATFLDEHRLPASYAALAEEYFLPLAGWLHRRRGDEPCLLLGINGAQGTGKSTLAGFLTVAMQELYGWNVAALSLDDFYLMRAERDALAAESHPLFATRGVPGTHDTTMLLAALTALRELRTGDSYSVPRFDKLVDDRAAPPWPVTVGPVHMIILEGWCIGTPPQPAAALVEPVNELERQQDPDRHWRSIVNQYLEGDYAEIFGLLDALVFLRAPSFDAVYRWRLEQEEKLADTHDTGTQGRMSAEELRQFIAHFERLTRHSLETLGDRADVIFDLAPDHSVSACRYA